MFVTRRAILKMAATPALLAFQPTDLQAARVRVETGLAFGSTWRLVLPDTCESAQARSMLEASLARIDRLMSPFRPDSDLGRFNAAGLSLVSDETAFVTRAALVLAGESGGAFDPTLAPIGRRFGFGPVILAPDRPAGRFRDVRLSGNRLTTASPGLTLDLCGIAKGYALDEARRTLDGLEFLLEVGGEVIARGCHPSGRHWRAGIARPGSHVAQRMVSMDGSALATSGDAAQHYVVGQRRYAHVMDPSTRSPVNRGVASVSVLAATGLIADSLATAAMVMGPEAARPLLKACDARALFLMRRPEGLEEVDVNGFTGGGVS